MPCPLASPAAGAVVLPNDVPADVCVVEEVSKGQCCDASTNMGGSLCQRRRKTGISAPDVHFLSLSTPARHLITRYGR